jgi:hypothetical protein
MPQDELAALTGDAQDGKMDWYDPPILFPIFLVVLIVGYALLRTPP